ncbi:recombination protein NinB [Rahnella inusitata]|uniref:recombination protein NinB n=1 Tax=Rahnella inusitata TaxID=58169 RepID=UPI0039BE25EC
MTKQTYQLRNEQILSNAINHLRNTPLNPDKPYFVTIQEATRSLSQNAKLWCCLTDISEQVVWYGQKLSTDDWKNILTASLKGQRSAPGINGGFVVLGQSTSRMTVGEMSELIEMMSAFGTEKGVRWSDESRQALEWSRRFGETKRAA